MKTLILTLVGITLTACGGSTLSVELTSREDGQALSGADTLTGVKSVNLTFIEISAHLSGKDAPDESDGGVKDDDKGWVLLSDQETTIDLMTLRQDARAPLGEAVAVPEGKITQIRLKVKGGEELSDGMKFAGAVTDADGTACDLILPKSAVNPGIKLSGVFKAAAIEGSENVATVNLKLSDSSKVQGGGCSFRLNPVLKFESTGKAAVKTK